MTFLEFLCRQMLGPPDVHADGPYWPCPQCASEKFHLRPHRPEYKDRFSCWSCAWWGDAADLLRHFHPREDYGKRCQRLAALGEEFKSAGHEEEARQPAGSFRSFRGLPGSHGRPRDAAQQQDEETSPLAESTLKLLLCEGESLLTRLGLEEPTRAARLDLLTHVMRALEFCHVLQVHPAALAGRIKIEVQIGRHELEHLAQCLVPGCDWAVCRRDRGWTEEEIRADIEASKPA